MCRQEWCFSEKYFSEKQEGDAGEKGQVDLRE